MSIDRSTLLRAVSLIALLLFLSLGSGCRSYAKLTSAEANQLMQALYTACSSKSVTRLDQVEARLEELERTAGSISAEESAEIERIVALARDGQWEAARDDAYQFAAAQVR
jgi:hypothetical protein